MAIIESHSNVSTTQLKIANIARKYETVKSLNHYLDRDLLMEAYSKTRKDGALGIDGKGAEEFATDLVRNLDRLVSLSKTGKYKAPPVRRVHIPKGSGVNEMRPLGIPCFSDKVLQKACQMLLEPIYETIFYDSSYGFRPGKSAHDCIRDLRSGIHELGGCFVVDVDIRKYFDSIPSSELRDILQYKVQDGVVNRLIAKWLKAGVMENGNTSFSDVGAPQGGIISPLISNIYLHYVLDEWFHETVTKHTQTEVRIYRYADDFVILCKTEHEARRILKALNGRFSKYKLEIHPSKTRIVDFRKPKPGSKSGSFNFLGFTFYWGYNRKKNRVIRVKTAKDRFSRALGRFNDLCREIRHWPLKDQIRRLNRGLHGHYNYYGVSFNQRGVWKVRYQVTKIWRYWLNRRSQKRKMAWYKFKFVLNNHKVAYPKRMVTLW